MAQEGKFDEQFKPFMYINLCLTLEHELDYMIQGYQLELYADYESAFIMRNIAFLFELQS